MKKHFEDFTSYRFASRVQIPARPARARWEAGRVAEVFLPVELHRPDARIKA